MQENTFDIGWNDNKARTTFGSGNHVSAITTLHTNYAPHNLTTVFVNHQNPDHTIWRNSL